MYAAEMAMRGRVLTEEQSNTLISALAPFAGSPITVASVVSDLEARMFAEQLASVFLKAGLSCGALQIVAVVAKPHSLVLQVRSKDDAPSYAVPLQRALERMALEAGGEISEAVPAGGLRLIVGPKPVSSPSNWATTADGR